MSRLWLRRAALCMALSSACLLSVGRGADAQECTDENYTVSPDLLAKATEKVVEDALGVAGKKTLERLLLESRLAQPLAGFGKGAPPSPLAAIGSKGFKAFMENLPTVQKAIQATESLVAGDNGGVMAVVLEVGGEKVLAAAGVPFAAQIVATVQIVKLSMDELKHQQCLLDIDVSYYRFVDDPRLSQGTTSERINHFIFNYLRGEGRDPVGGTDRQVNRRYLQCFINESLPADEQIQVYDSAPVFGRLSGAVIDWDNRGLRTAVTVMLSDFKARRQIELQREKAAEYLKRPDFAAMKELVALLGSYPKLGDALCREYVKLVSAAKPAAGAAGGGGSFAGEWVDGTARWKVTDSGGERFTIDAFWQGAGGPGHTHKTSATCQRIAPNRATCTGSGTYNDDDKRVTHEFKLNVTRVSNVQTINFDMEYTSVDIAMKKPGMAPYGAIQLHAKARGSVKKAP